MRMFFNSLNGGKGRGFFLTRNTFDKKNSKKNFFVVFLRSEKMFLYLCENF